MTIPGINLYSASAILSEIDDVTRFQTKEKLAAYAGLVPRQDQSGNRDIRGHITEHGPSILRYILVTAAHVTKGYSKKMKDGKEPCNSCNCKDPFGVHIRHAK